MFPSEVNLLSRRSFLILAAVFAGIPPPAEEPAQIAREAVESSTLTSIGYNAVRKILEVEFHSGSVYRYLEVPKGVFAGLMAAESKGRYFTAHIRNGYRFERVKAGTTAKATRKP